MTLKRKRGEKKEYLLFDLAEKYGSVYLISETLSRQLWEYLLSIFFFFVVLLIIGYCSLFVCLFLKASRWNSQFPSFSYFCILFLSLNTSLWNIWTSCFCSVEQLVFLRLLSLCTVLFFESELIEHLL